MTLDVELIGAEEVRVKGRIEKKRKGYKKYNDAVNRINLVGWIKEEIARRPDRIIVVKIDDVAKEMGPEFENAGYPVMYQALKVILFQNGIFLSMATHKDGDKTFVLREVREGDELAPSYSLIKNRIKQEEILDKEEKKRRKKKDFSIEVGVESSRGRIRKEKLILQEKERERERQEKIAMREEIKKLKEILRGRLGRKSCMIEIFQFNWNTLTWRMVKRSSVRTYLRLLDVVMDNTSNTENRYRIEFTPLYNLENTEKEFQEDENKDNMENEHEKKGGEIKDIIKEGHGMDIADLAKISGKLEDLKRPEKVEAIGEGQLQSMKLECPRCGGKNIKTWSKVQVIKTRSGDRKLRHRCADCNETFTDEDIGINY